MSDDEKAKQVGRATIQYQAALEDCAHVELKIEQVFEAYRFAGGSMDPRNGKVREPELIDGTLVIGVRGFNFDPATLLNGGELAELVAERDQLRERLKKASSQMRRLGMAHVL